MSRKYLSLAEQFVDVRDASDEQGNAVGRDYSYTQSLEHNSNTCSLDKQSSAQSNKRLFGLCTTAYHQFPSSYLLRTSLVVLLLLSFHFWLSSRIYFVVRLHCPSPPFDSLEKPLDAFRCEEDECEYITTRYALDSWVWRAIHRMYKNPIDV
jgi:hypothetical protein